MEQLGLPAFREEILEFVAHFDDQGRGVLRFEEFVPVFLAHSTSSEDRQDTLKEAFSLFDLEGDGRLSPSEIRRVLESLGVDASTEEVADFVLQVDSAGEGRISFEDFSRIVG